jgi:hypothetical protein
MHKNSLVPQKPRVYSLRYGGSAVAVQWQYTSPSAGQAQSTRRGRRADMFPAQCLQSADRDALAAVVLAVLHCTALVL